MSELHPRLKKAIEARLFIARMATPGPWFPITTHPFGVSSKVVAEGNVDSSISDNEIWMITTTLSNRQAPDAVFLSVNSPDIIERQCLADLRRLERHDGLHMCTGVLHALCPEIEDLAEVYGIEE